MGLHQSLACVLCTCAFTTAGALSSETCFENLLKWLSLTSLSWRSVEGAKGHRPSGVEPKNERATGEDWFYQEELVLLAPGLPLPAFPECFWILYSHGAMCVLVLTNSCFSLHGEFVRSMTWCTFIFVLSDKKKKNAIIIYSDLNLVYDKHVFVITL